MKKPLPIGVADYRRLREDGYYFVDKSLMIQDLLEKKTIVTLITRPRRFGKTLNMSMFSEFFDITKDSRDIFADTKIMRTSYASYMNQYPTIYVSFANAKGSLQDIAKEIKLQLRNEYDRYAHVFSDLGIFDREEYEDIIYHSLRLSDRTLDNISNVLSFLMKMLEKYYGKKVMVFIDEYDTPFIEAHVNGFYEKIRGPLALLLHNALKSSLSLQYALLTGIQRVAKENIFSDLNNLSVYSVKDEAYASYFGFDEKEVSELLSYYGLELDEGVKEMYDGYRMGNQDIYNPWSIIKYADTGALSPYWLNTSANQMIKSAFKDASQAFQEEYESLILQGKLDTWVQMETSFFEVSSTESLWGLLVNAGYLTIARVLDPTNGYYTIRIPNQEVQKEFRSLTAYHMHLEDTDLSRLFQALYYGKKDQFIVQYKQVLLRLPSYHDLKDENSYHMMMLGMSAWLSEDYVVQSNRESRTGRYDIMLKAKHAHHPSYLFEFKYTGDAKCDLTQLAKKAVEQIIHNKYDVELKGKVIEVGLAHRGKNCEIVWVERKNKDA